MKVGVFCAALAIGLGTAAPVSTQETFSTADPLLAGVADIAFTPAGDAVLVAGDDGSLSCWSPALTRRLWHRAPPSEAPPTCIALAPAQLALLLGDREGRVHIVPWQEPPWESEPLFGGAAATAIAADPSSPLLLVGCQSGELVLWHSESGQVVRRWQGHEGRIAWAGLSEDGTLAVSAGGDFKVRVWDSGSGERLDEWRPSPIKDDSGEVREGLGNFLGLDLAAGRLLTVTPVEGVRLWRLGGDGDLEQDRDLGLRDVTAAIRCCRLRPDGLMGVLVLPGRVLVWDSRSGDVWARSYEGADRVSAASFSPDLRRLVLGRAEGHPFEMAVDDLRDAELVSGKGAPLANLLAAVGSVLATGAASAGEEPWQAGHRLLPFLGRPGPPEAGHLSPRGGEAREPAAALVALATLLPAPPDSVPADACRIACSVQNLGRAPARDVRLALSIRDSRGVLLRTIEARIGDIARAGASGWIFAVDAAGLAGGDQLELELVAREAGGERSRPCVLNLP